MKMRTNGNSTFNLQQTGIETQLLSDVSGLFDGNLNSKKMFCMTLFKSSPWRDVHRTDTLGPAWGLCMCVLVMGIVGNKSFPG